MKEICHKCIFLLMLEVKSMEEQADEGDNGAGVFSPTRLGEKLISSRLIKRRGKERGVLVVKGGLNRPK